MFIVNEIQEDYEYVRSMVLWNGLTEHDWYVDHEELHLLP